MKAFASKYTIVSLVIASIILYICYPGFMSYDSIRMLEEARTSVRGGVFPAMPAYVLRLFDLSGHGPSVMIGIQNLILIACMMFMLNAMRVNIYLATIVLLIIILNPTVLGSMLVLWKDVTLTAFVVLSLVLIFKASLIERTERKEGLLNLLKYSSLLSLFVGTLLRFNAITATFIIAIYWIYVFYKDSLLRSKVLLFITVMLLMVGGNKVINNYSFPYFKKLETNPLVYTIMSYDLVGISGWSRESLLPISSASSSPVKKVPIEDIDKIYSPLGVLIMNQNNIEQGNVVKIYSKPIKNEDIAKAWLDGIASHPLAYLRYRWDLFAEIIGAKSYETYEPTHFNRIDKNRFGINFQDNDITDMTLDYVRYASDTIIGKPWFVFLISLLSIVTIARNKAIDSKLKTFAYCASLASMSYIVPFYFVSGTGEVRYAFPSIILACLTILISIFGRAGLRFEAVKNKYI